jgi:hypothetical protein
MIEVHDLSNANKIEKILLTSFDKPWGLQNFALCSKHCNYALLNFLHL